MKPPFGLLSQYEKIDKLLQESGGEITEELEVELKTTLDLNTSAGVDNIHALMERIEHDAAFYKLKASRYTAVQRGLTSAYEKIKIQIKSLMVIAGKTELHGDEIRLQLRRIKDKLVVDEDRLPKSYLKEKVTLVPDTDRIRDDLERGLPVAGAELVPNHSLNPLVQKAKIAI